MSKIICFLFIGKCQPQFDVNQLTKLISKVVDQHYDILSELFPYIANQLFQGGLISNKVKDNPTGNNIIEEFKQKLNYFHKQSQVEEHCKRLLHIFAGIGGSFKYAAEMLRTEWLEKAKIGMGVDLNL